MKLYREVLWPDCGKKYMTYVYDGEFDTVIKNPDKWMFAGAETHLFLLLLILWIMI